MLEGVGRTEDAHRTGGARLDGYHHGLVGQEAVGLATERPEALLQSGDDGLRQPEVQRRRDEAGGIRTFREVEAETPVDEVGHALGRGRLPAIALLPA